MVDAPIYVAGLERSGTSLMYALLASHPRITMTRRTNLWTYFYDQFGDLAEEENLERCLAVMRRYKRIVKLQPDYERLRTDFLRGPATYGRLFALLEGQQAERQGKPRWGDKSLHTERYADAIFAAYPGARIVHMMRDPRDRYASVQTRWRSRRGGAGASTAEWRTSARLAMRNEDRFADRYRVVRYETLAAQPEETMRQVCAFIGEEYTPDLLAMHGAQQFRDKGSNSSYGARQAGVISTDSIGRFVEVLAPQQLAFIQVATAAGRRRFGYDTVPTNMAARARLAWLVADAPVEAARLLGWQIRRQVRSRTRRRVPSYRFVDVEAAA